MNFNLESLMYLARKYKVRIVIYGFSVSIVGECRTLELYYEMLEKLDYKTVELSIMRMLGIEREDEQYEEDQ